MNVFPLSAAERAELVRLWRQQRRLLFRLATEMDGFDRAVEWLNAQLTPDDFYSDLRAYGFSQDDIDQMMRQAAATLGERKSPQPSEPLSSVQH